MDKITTLCRKLIGSLFYLQGDMVEAGRRRLFVIFLMALIPPLIIFGMIQNHRGFYHYGLIDYFLALLFTSFIFILRYLKTGLPLYRITSILFLLLLLYWVKTGAVQGYASIWVLVAPPFVFFLMGRKEGLFWSVLVGLLTAILFIDPFSNLTSFDYSADFISRHLFSLFLIVSFTYNYEFVREKFQKAMEAEQDKLLLEKDLLSQAKHEVDLINAKLSGEVKTRKRAEDELRKHRDHLEDLVSVRTRELRKTNEELEAEKKLYRMFTDNVNDLIWTTDLDLNFAYVSPSVSRIYGYTVEEAMNTKLDKWFTPESYLRIMKRYEALKTEGEMDPELLYSSELEQIKKDGTVFAVEIKWVLARDSVGKAVGFVGVTRDISERRKAEEEKRSLEGRLQRAEKMEALGQLAGGVAHDLNNVLGILSGYSELLLMEFPEGKQGRRHVEKILQSTEKGAAIIQDLLTLARRGVTVSTVINLNDVVSDFLKTPVFEKIMSYHRQVAFRTEFDDDLLNIKGSPVHLEKTIMNLVSNAAEAISGRGEVTIRTESRYLDKAVSGYDEVKEGDYTVLTVSDTGMGIPAEHREKIFEPFYTKKTMGRSGTGLGLAIVWGTVKDHNGYIDIQSKVGTGTTFTLYFPATREDLTVPQQKIPIERYMGQGESVLVVDDIPEQRDVASGLLTQLGYRVHTVSSGEEAVEFLKQNNADILVLDMIMAPRIDGLETYRRVLEINPKQKAILVSGFSETDRVREAQKLGAGAYVKKPYVLEKIGVALRDELGR